jgi:hypothetical protein
MKLIQLFESRLSKRVTGKKPEDFATYLRSVNDIVAAVQEKYGDGVKPNLKLVIALFAHHNMVVADNVTVTVSPESLYPYREYDRNVRTEDNGLRWTGKLTEEEYNELRDEIKRDGKIKNPVYLTLKRLSDGDLEVYLGEGNHRLRIAQELGLDSMPLKFVYYK